MSATGQNSKKDDAGSREPDSRAAMMPGIPLYRSAQVRAADASIIAAGITGYELMCRAAGAALRALRARWPLARDLLVICGGGNNGGDGYVLARLALAAGLAPRVMALTAVERLRGDAARAAAECRAAGVPVLGWSGSGHATAEIFAREQARCDVLIDALLGIGLADEVRGDAAAIIALINDARRRTRRPVVALDVPSGLCADTGRVRGLAVQADLTVTFILHKAGLLLDQGPVQTGEVVLEDLEADTRLVQETVGTPVLRVLPRSSLRERLGPRARAAHKGDAGHVLVIGGGEGMPGAARLAGEAALRAGAGRVTVLCDAASAMAIAAGRAELMVRAIDSIKEIPAWVTAADVLAIGPGLGQSDWAKNIFAAAIAAAGAARRPVVIDADALNLLAIGQVDLPRDCVLTPHPGEAARLLGIEAATIQGDRLAALAALQQRYGATVVLKGAGSLITADSSGHPPWMCTAGNPAMAAPGMGDVLTGVIAALLGQGLSAADAARVGVLWHALAGDAAAQSFASRGVDSVRLDRGVLAGEVGAWLPRVFAGGFG